ncbi:MAG: signal peptide peptidase SppA [Acidilobaceae archaeon]|nr:signal peptide peptidase SppA [Acidilobaceae archaeon]
MRTALIVAGAIVLSMVVLLTSLAAAFWLLGLREAEVAAPTEDYIALVELSGVIDYSEDPLFGGDVISPRGVEEIVEGLLKDEKAKAVVLVINSPGGTSAAFEVYEHIKRLSERKVVVVYFTDVGASGGYLIALPADHIVAHPTSLVGSVGAIAALLNYKGLLDKLGIKVAVVESGDLKDVGSPYRELTEEDIEFLRDIVRAVADHFAEKVREHRGDKISDMSEVLRAGVYPGARAKELGLVDEVGTLSDAVSAARRLAGLPEDAPIKRIERPVSILDVLSRLQLPFIKTQPTVPLSVEVLLMWPLPQLPGIVTLSPWD